MTIGLRGLLLTLALVAAASAARGDEVPAAPSAAASPSVAAAVAIHAKAEPDTVTIGTHVRYTLEISVPAGVEVVVSQPAERLGDFDIIDFGDAPPVSRDGTTTITRWYTLVGFETGHKLVRSPPVQVRQPGGARVEAAAAEIVITVESVLAQAGDASDIRDIRPPEEPPTDWWPYYLAGAAIAALAALTFAVRRLLGRGARARPAAPPRPAHEIAIEDIERLRARRLIEEGAFKEYYSLLSTIVRTYLERRFGLRAPEMTTEEFLLTSARSGRLEAAHRTLLGEFLIESDLVKFARHRPTIADSERACSSARRFVDETAAPDPTAHGKAARAGATAGDARPAPTGADSRERKRRAAG